MYRDITLHTGKAHQIHAKPDSGALAARYAHRRADGIQNSEHDSGQNTQSGDLIQRERALRDKDGGGGNDQTFD